MKQTTIRDLMKDPAFRAACEHVKQDLAEFDAQAEIQRKARLAARRRLPSSSVPPQSKTPRTK